ncbi:hypothetical protein JTB14_001180 [Gonioctena quinquepunctata]|nr:hypothetical protein JTB14_001180 [Gonioctena quinquepunctata]
MNSLDFSSNDKKTDDSEHVKISVLGNILVAVTGGLALGVTVVSIPFVSPALRKFCLPYVPATNTQITNILAALKGRSGTLLDLGSGDGRIVIEAAKCNFLSHGVELNPWLVYYSKLWALRNGLHKSTRFFRRDLWRYNISKYDNIVIFGVEQMMDNLEKKFLSECKPECCIIACRFPLPNRTPIKTIGQGVDTVWVYSCKN